MILLCGIPTESPLAMVREALDGLGAPYLLLNQRQFSIMGMMLEISSGQTAGRLQVNGDSYPLEEFTAGATDNRHQRYRLQVVAGVGDPGPLFMESR